MVNELFPVSMAKGYKSSRLQHSPSLISDNGICATSAQFVSLVEPGLTYPP
jgi:hypothetical protein